MRRALIVFLDGVGVGADDPRRNPFAAGACPRLSERIGGFPTLSRPSTEGSVLRASGLDARLDMPGLPQSATGQASLFSGENAARHLGHHKGPYPGPRVKEVIARSSLFRRAQAAGAKVCLANGYPPEYWRDIERRRRRHTATVEAARAGGAEVRGLAELRDGRAVSLSLTNAYLRERLGHDVPRRSAAEAGRILSGLSAESDLTVFEYSATDWAGHRGTRAEADALLDELDVFLDAAIGGLPAATGFFLVSDHGNLEDLATRAHTTNAALYVRPAGLPSPEPRALTDFSAELLSFLRPAAVSA